VHAAERHVAAISPAAENAPPAAGPAVIEATPAQLDVDGDPLPGDVGVPTDIVRFRGALHVLTSRALLRLDDTGPTVLSTIADKRSPF